MEKINAISLKAKIRNIAKTKGVSAQVVLQNYFFVRFRACPKKDLLTK